MVKNLTANAGDVGDKGWIPGSGRFPGGGNGNPLQYSCLENPMDREAWQATIHGITKVGHDWPRACLCTHVSMHTHTHTQLLKTIKTFVLSTLWTVCTWISVCTFPWLLLFIDSLNAYFCLFRTGKKICLRLEGLRRSTFSQQLPIKIYLFKIYNNR